jgi:hypothetical protein
MNTKGRSMALPVMLSKSGLSAVNLETLARLEVLYQARRAGQKLIATARDYYNGDHPTLLTDRQREFLHHGGRLKFSMNYCRLVIDALVERLRVAGIKASDERTGSWLWNLWKAARLDALSKMVQLAAVRDGEAFVIVDFDPLEDRPRFSLNLADDGGGGVSMVYDAEGQPVYAAKRWTVDSGTGAGTTRRLNLYYPDRIEKYISTTIAPHWQPYQPDGEPFPLPWLDRFGDPLGIPVVPLRNRDDGTGQGVSEISDVIPLQDALNKTLIDLIAVADTNAFPLLVALGFEVPDDFTISPGALIQVPQTLDSQPDFKMFPGTDLGNFIAVLQHLVLEIARISSTPLSRFQATGQVAAEGTLKQQEAGLISKVEDRQITFGDAWEDALRLAVRLQNTFGAARYDDLAQIEILWYPAAPRSELEHLQTLLLKAQLGVPLNILLAEAGYSPDEKAGL